MGVIIKGKEVMRKPLPQDFGMTPQQYLDALEQLRVVRENCIPLLRLTFLLTQLAGCIGGGWLAYKIAVHFGSEQGSAMGISIPCGFIALYLTTLLIGDFAEGLEVRLLSRLIFRQVEQYKEALGRYSQTSIEFWLSLKGDALEKEVAKLYRRMGYVAIQTPSSGDEGIDLILERNNRRIIMQCKGRENPVGPSIARDLYGTLLHSGACRAVLVCPAGFTRGVAKFAKGKPIDLVSADELISLATKINGQK
jgi:hypothetical protein